MSGDSGAIQGSFKKEAARIATKTGSVRDKITASVELRRAAPAWNAVIAITVDTTASPIALHHPHVVDGKVSP